METEPALPRRFDNASATFLRTVQTHHVALSQMADQKANALIAASFVVFSIVFHQGTTSGFSPTLITLSATCFAACFFASLAILPRARKKRNDTPNPLFFGSFAQHSSEDFQKNIDQILSSGESIAHAMSEDIYQLGCVLHRHKYRYLRYAYLTFLSGLSLTAMAALYSWIQG